MRKQTKIITTRSNKPTDSGSSPVRRRKLQLEESSDWEKAPSPKRQATGQKMEAKLRAEDLDAAQAIRAEAEHLA